MSNDALPYETPLNETKPNSGHITFRGSFTKEEKHPATIPKVEEMKTLNFSKEVSEV